MRHTIILTAGVGATLLAASSAFAPERGALVRITVAEDAPYTRAHVITVSPDTDPYARSRAQIDGRRWRARRDWEGGSESITSDDCPVVRDVALSFAALPDVPIAPESMRVHGPGTPLPATRKDGFSTRLAFETVTLDGSQALVEIQGGNAYAAWGHDAVSRLLACWGPLPPASAEQAP